MSKNFHYKLTNLPKYLNHKALKDLIIKNFNVENSDFKLHFYFKGKTAIIESKKEIEVAFFEYKNKKIEIKKTEKREKKKMEKSENIDDIRKVVTPLFNLKYEETISLKEKELQKDFKNIKIEFEKSEIFLRNKFEFAFGFENERKKQSVGFRGGKYSEENINTIFCPLNVVFMPPCIKENIKIIQKLLQKEIYKEIVYKRDTKKGFLKLILMRTNYEKTINLVSVTSINENVMEFLNELSLSIQNLHYTIDSGITEKMPESEIFKVRGEDFLIQKVLEKEFKLSFHSFFQTNIKIFECIISDIRKELQAYEKNILLDLCCGTGAIGILLSDLFKKVIGIEINEECFNNFSYNSTRNNINNYLYKNMDIRNISDLHIEDEKQIAILDPPRAGVHKNVIKTIRRNEKIKTVFFICCDYKNSKKNLEDFLRAESKEFLNAPFFIEKIKGYDMFPFMKQFEVLFILKRIQ